MSKQETTSVSLQEQRPRKLLQTKKKKQQHYVVK